MAKIKKSYTEMNVRFSNVDRGGVKPLEQVDKTAPENRSDSALVHDDDNINIDANRKAPLRELFGVTNNLVRSSLVNLATSIPSPQTMSIAIIHMQES